MEVMIIREIFSDQYTHGRLYINNVFECYTLEDTDRHLEIDITKKIKGKSAIPLPDAGGYNVEITKSFRFGRMMPLVEDVPGFSGIRIHSGNTSEDTDGCILVGNARGNDRVLDSRSAYSKLFAKLTNALKAEKVRLRIVRAI